MSTRIPGRGRRGSMAPLVEWSPPSLFRHPGRQRPNLAPEAFDLRKNRLDLRQGQLADGTLHIQAGWWASRDQRGQRDILGGMWHINDHGRRLHFGADVGRLRVCPPRRRGRRSPWLSRDTLRASSLTATPTRAVWGVSAWSAPPMFPRAILLSAVRVLQVFVTPTSVIPIPASPVFCRAAWSHVTFPRSDSITHVSGGRR